MFTVSGVLKFHGWTHASMNLLLDHLATIPESDYERQVPGFGFGTLRNQVVHVFNCEAFWVHVLRGISYFDRKPEECRGVAAARLLQQEVTNQTHAYLAALTDERVNTRTELRFPDGDVAARTPALVLHHVLTHAFHHKGQIVAMCRLLGHPAPDTDLNQFE